MRVCHALRRLFADFPETEMTHGPDDFRITSEMAEDFQHRAACRERIARPLAVAALRSIEKMGFRAWVVGSLAEETFTVQSDVDFLVDCGQEREHALFLALEEEMGDFPFDLVFCRWVEEDAMAHLMETAKNASELVEREASWLQALDYTGFDYALDRPEHLERELAQLKESCAKAGRRIPAMLTNNAGTAIPNDQSLRGVRFLSWSTRERKVWRIGEVLVLL
jgi:predicted nucleotidyltransferase